jgi:hypothetical protein
MGISLQTPTDSWGRVAKASAMECKDKGGPLALLPANCNYLSGVFKSLWDVYWFFSSIGYVPV